MPSTTTAKCSKCGEPVEPNSTDPCPNCGGTGKKVVVGIPEHIDVHDSVSAGKNTTVVISEHINLHDSVSVTTETRREQFQKKPYKIYFAVALLIASVVVAFIDHDLSLPLGIILAVNGAGQTPINEKIIITTRERH